MIKSMTGYGAAKGFSGKTEISLELKSVNSRYLDCTIKIPRMFIAIEETLKAAVGKSISRGKVDVFVTIDTSNSGDVDIKINRPLAKAYISSLRGLASEYGISDSIDVVDVARFPDVVQVVKNETDTDKLCADVCLVLENALKGFDDMRTREGASLCKDITSRLDVIDKLTNKAEELSPQSVADYAAKLEARMREFLGSTEIDEQRILTEAAIFADRIAISEETVRLKSHVAQLRELLGSAEPVGRKLDFLVQELNREANTIGSKGNDSEMAKITVELKSEIEKIREQAQNIE